MKSINPTTGQVIQHYSVLTQTELQQKLSTAQAGFELWRNASFTYRRQLLQNTANLLRNQREELALLMAAEMGKPLQDGRDEIDKCALCCEYYATHAEALLQDEPVATDARESFITYQPLGVLLAIMPWNFPFWQVFRFAAPNLMAGNTGLLKHASNVSGCALAIEALFREAGFPEGVFSTLLIRGEDAEALIAHPTIRAVTFTGSTAAGKKVAAAAGAALKKTVLELGGSDPYIILADADVEEAASICAKSRLINAGQSCVAAKRFIVEAPVRAAFEAAFLRAFQHVRFGDPHRDTIQIGPLARIDLRDQLHTQVLQTIAQGATCLLGGQVPPGPGAFYTPTILTGVTPGMVAFEEELFGPVAAIIEAANETEAVALANQSPYGLGSAIFTRNQAKGRALARTAIDAGQTFVNTLVKSDPHLPFGGTKESGYGRELGYFGVREFVNAKTVYLA